MRIVGSQIQASTQHALRHSEQRITVRSPLPPASPPPATVPKPASTPRNADSTAEGYDDQLSLLKSLVEALSGTSIRTLRIDTAAAATETSAPPISSGSPASNAPALRIDATQVSETEITEVKFSGQFSTADGQQLSLSLQFTLQRNYSATSISATIGNPKATDPLVLNFDGRGARLDPALTQFDLNSDGNNEALPTLAPGSAYLAFDRNGDGKITNGSELFGPTSGDGFADLRQLDGDGSGFIDSGDSDFAKLFLFRPGSPLETLASKDIGVIFLGNVASPARLTDSNNQSLGQLRASSFYLTNQGGAGLVQQLDLVV